MDMDINMDVDKSAHFPPQPKGTIKNVNLISLGKSDVNFYGYFEDEDCFVDFVYPFDEQLRVDYIYPRIDYADYHHFLRVIEKFIPKTIFFEEPLFIAEMTLENLEAAYKTIMEKYGSN